MKKIIIFTIISLFSIPGFGDYSSELREYSAQQELKRERLTKQAELNTLRWSNQIQERILKQQIESDRQQYRLASKYQKN